MATDDNRVDWYGTPKADNIDDFYGLHDVIYGGQGDDTLAGGFKSGSTSVLVGGAGRDVLKAVSEHDVLRFDTLTDSYRDAVSAHFDTIEDFDASQDTLDLTALGYTTIGDGHGASLKVLYNAAQDLTYLKSFDENSQGQRFELAFKGDYSDTLSQANFPQLVSGTPSNDQLNGSAAVSVTLAGYAGRDTLVGGAADERLIGGGGGDTLTGGLGADAFVYTDKADSSKFDTEGNAQARDLIKDFSLTQGDTIDLSQLGFSGLGDGHDGTVKVTVNATGDKTALKSLDTDEAGNLFEIQFEGNVADQLNRDSVIFANTNGDTIQNSLTRDDQELLGTAGDDVILGGAARDEMLGFEGNDTLNGGTGHDSMAGGKGADLLTGGEGRDDFVFYSIAESYRTATADHSDLITDYESGDIIYALDLGFTKVADGTNGTLLLEYDAGTNQTFLHSLEADDHGRFFQITLAGEHDKVSIALDGLYVDEQPIQIIGVNPTDPAPV
jgi:Ca2+-binding RTX toxin-like protein